MSKSGDQSDDMEQDADMSEDYTGQEEEVDLLNQYLPQLHDAITANNHVMVRDILDQFNRDINGDDPELSIDDDTPNLVAYRYKGLTALERAVTIAGSLEIQEILYSEGADIYGQNGVVLVPHLAPSLPMHQDDAIPHDATPDTTTAQPEVPTPIQEEAVVSQEVISELPPPVMVVHQETTTQEPETLTLPTTVIPAATLPATDQVEAMGRITDSSIGVVLNLLSPFPAGKE